MSRFLGSIVFKCCGLAQLELSASLSSLLILSPQNILTCMFGKQICSFSLNLYDTSILSHDVNVISADPLSVSLLFCSVLSVLRFRQFALQFRCQFGAPYPCSLARLFFLRSVVGANFVSLETGKERTRRRDGGGGPSRARLLPLYRRERIK